MSACRRSGVILPVVGEIGVPLSSEPKRTLSSDRPNLSAFGTQGFSVRSVYNVLRKVNEFNRLNHGVALTSACRTKVRTNDLQSEQLPVLVRYATVWKLP